MKQHYIIMSSSYVGGTRIAIDISEKCCLNSEYINALLKKIMAKCGDDVSLSTHTILAESESWDSVLKADAFFENVKVIQYVDEFIKEINKSRTLRGVDIAKYILSKISCTHLKLQKLVYFCFADYICETGKNLFKDEIYAFKYGPVVKSVYDTYKSYGDRAISDGREWYCDDLKNIQKHPKLESPWRSRILFAVDGVTKLFGVDSTLSKYKNFGTSKLINLTHSPNSPWSKVCAMQKGNSQTFLKIPNDYIQKYHHCETVN